MYTNQELADKIGFAGSIEKVLDDGVTADEIEDSTISALWQDLEFLYEDFQEAISALDEALAKYYEPFNRRAQFGNNTDNLWSP
jgi:hypothetical protein